MTSYALSIGTPGTPDEALLGAKGAALARMMQLGLPVPPGFTVTTAMCRHLHEHGAAPTGVTGDVDRQLESLEAETGRRFGDADDPLLLAVRPGAPVPVPGLMDTLLDVGLTAASVTGLARATGDERFAWDCYRRLVQTFGELVLGVPASRLAEVTAALLVERDAERLLDLDAAALRELVRRSEAACVEAVGSGLPQDPRRQLDLAIDAAFASWDSEAARLGRRQCAVPESAGMAVSVQAMVYGNRGEESGTGLAFTRSPATGAPGDHGFYVPDAQGEDARAGGGAPRPLSSLRTSDPVWYRGLRSVMDVLERHHRDMCEIEFTVESGRLWVLQAGPGERGPAAAFRIAGDLVEEGVITEDEALLHVTGDQLTQLMAPILDEASAGHEVAAGLGISSGVVVGRVALDAEQAAALTERGEDVVLFCPGDGPDDLRGLPHARAVVTAADGPATAVGIAARARGVPAVCGIRGLVLDRALRHVDIGGRFQLAEGDMVSVDGGTGRIYRGRHRMTPSALRRRLDGETGDPEDHVVPAVLRLLEHADRIRRLRVGADVTTATDVRRAVRYGADSVRMCRCDCVLLGDRRTYVERVLHGRDPRERSAALAHLGRLQREAFSGILDAADGRAVTVRLFATDPEAGARADLLDSQVAAALEAVADLRDRGRPFDLELVPSVDTLAEAEMVADRVREVADAVALRRGRVSYRLGASVEGRPGSESVVCMPDQVPAARLEAARAVLLPTSFLAEPPDLDRLRSARGLGMPQDTSWAAERA